MGMPTWENQDEIFTYHENGFIIRNRSVAAGILKIV